ncbi:MAG: RIP metalloprotease RseP [bacterium]|nr:RIP metalloprotease RseP [bacterium]
MDILAVISQNLIPFLLILTVLVFVHELGHYLSARRHGVKVDVFSIGFGPEIFGWTDKAETRWKFSLIPLGGYVKMFGDQDAASRPDHEKASTMTDTEKGKSLLCKNVWQRIEVSAAGPLANYVFAILVLATLFATTGQPKWAEEARIGVILSGSAAEKAGLQEEDTVIAINGAPIKTFEEMGALIQESTDEQPLQLLVNRLDQSLPQEISVVPDRKEGRVALGVMRAQDLVTHGPLVSIWEATKYSVELSGAMLSGVWKMITGEVSSKGLAGPLGIAQISGEIAQRDWAAILSFMALLSINLGLINLFPIPMLDGGHLLFYFIEAARGRPLSEKTQEIGFRIGFGFVMALFIYVTFNDVTRLFGN